MESFIKVERVGRGNQTKVGPPFYLCCFALYVGVATGYFCFLNFAKWRTTREDEKINKPSEDTIDVASTSFGNTNKLSNQEIFMLFKMQK